MFEPIKNVGIIRKIRYHRFLWLIDMAAWAARTRNKHRACLLTRNTIGQEHLGE